MNLATLTLPEVQALADNFAVYSRGYEYYSWDAAGRLWLSEDNHELTARVSGSSGVYHVKVSDKTTPTGGKLVTECDCPYEAAICKHIVAALVKFVEDYRDADDKAEDWDADEDENWDEDENDTPTTVTKSKAGLKEQPNTQEIPPALLQTLQAMSRQSLLDLILKLANTNQEFLRLLLENVTIAPPLLKKLPANKELVKKLKQDVTRYFKKLKQQAEQVDNDDYYYSHSRYNNYSEYDETEELSLQPTLELTAALNPVDRTAVYWHIVTTANKASSEYSIGDVEAATAIGLYGEALNEQDLPPTKREHHFDVLVAALDWFKSNDNIARQIKAALNLIASDPIDYRYLINLLTGTENRVAIEWVAGYYLKLGDREKYLQIRRANLNEEWQFLDLAEYWQSQNDTQRYVTRLEKWLEHLIASDPDVNNVSLNPLLFSYSSSIYHKSYYFPVRQAFSEFEAGTTLKLLAEHYRQTGDKANLCRILMAIARYGRDEISLDLQLYLEIEEVATNLGQWAKFRATLLQLAKAKPQELARIYLYEQDWEAAIQLALTSSSEVYRLNDQNVPDLVASSIKNRMPNDAMKIYEAVMQVCIDRRGRDNYKVAAHYAAEIKQIYLNILKNRDGWAEYIEAIRKQNNRLPALKDEFKSL